MITKETLKEYQSLQIERKNLADRIAKIEKLPEMERGALKAIKDLYEQNINKIVQIQISIEKALENLTSTERELVRLRYFDGLEWHQICSKINYSWRQTHYIHSKVLEKLGGLDSVEDV